MPPSVTTTSTSTSSTGSLGSTTSTTLPAGLVAAYGFNEGEGSNTADVSGRGNTGTISGAAWSPTGGRNGTAALTFDGQNDWVTVNDAASLDLTTAMTVEAWVFPTVLPTGWRTVVAKDGASGQVVYFLHASSASNQPATGVWAGGAERSLIGGTRPAANTWTHLAATYDGATQRLYVNGTQVTSRAQTGAIATSAGPLHIGGNGIWGEYFAGRIEDVRVYNRALLPAEIQADMARPVP